MTWDLRTLPHQIFYYLFGKEIVLLKNFLLFLKVFKIKILTWKRLKLLLKTFWRSFPNSKHPKHTIVPSRMFDYANAILLLFTSAATTSWLASNWLQTRKREIERNRKYCKLSEHDLIIYARYFNAISLPLCCLL